MSEPYEMIMSPFQIYLGPVGETFPEIQATPAGNWVLLGTNGKDNMGNEGIIATHGQTLIEHRNVGSTGIKKVVRETEFLTFEGLLEDLTATMYAKILNNNTVTPVAADSDTGGYSRVYLYQGRTVSLFAMLCRGVSPYGDSWFTHYQCPVVYQLANPAPAFTKSGVAALKFSFGVIEDPDAASEAARFGQMLFQTASPTG